MVCTYHEMYTTENFMSLLNYWEEIANKEEVSIAELAFRWIHYHSALALEMGHCIIFGASRFAQSRQLYNTSKTAY